MGMSAGTNALTDVAKVANVEGPEELVAEDSTIRDGLPGQSFMVTVKAICLLLLKCCVA
jgi:hypothetical protein